MTRDVTVVVHPVHPRSVGEAFATIDDCDVRFPEIEDVPELLTEADVLVGWHWRDDYLVPGLRWIQSVSVGVDQFPLAALRDAGIVLTSARGVHGPQVSEHAFALLLAMTRGIGASMRNAVRHEWRPIPGVEIVGSTLGVLGLGSIGEAIAEKADAWGLRVIGTKRNPERYAGVADRVVAADRTLEVFAESDIVVSTLPDTAETRGVVTRECLEALGGGWFVNVGRGTVVAEQDLLWALDQGHLLGAGLDVFEEEPLPDSSPLWDHPRVVLTSHAAGLSPNYGPRLLEIFRSNLDALTGRRSWVNRIV